MVTIEVNETVFLKQILLSDATELFATIDRERRSLRKWLPFVDYTRGISDSEDFIRSLYEKGSREIVFVINCQSRFAGLIGLKGIDHANHRCEIGYWLSEKFRGRGVMTAAVRALVDYAFGDLDMNRIQIKCAVENVASSNIPRKTGFFLEGIERDGELLADGQYVDLEVYSLVRRKDRIIT